MIFNGSRSIFYGFSWLQVGFMVFQGYRLVLYCSRSVFMVFQGSRLVIHGSKWVFMVFKVSGWFFEVPGGF